MGRFALTPSPQRAIKPDDLGERGHQVPRTQFPTNLANCVDGGLISQMKRLLLNARALRILLSTVSLNPRQRHCGRFSARQRGSTSHLKFDQPLDLIAITQAGRQQSRVNCRTPTTYANDAYDQDPNCDNPKESRWTNQTISSSFPDIVSPNRPIYLPPRLHPAEARNFAGQISFVA